MSFITTLRFAFVCLLALPTAAYCADVWKVSSPTNHVFIGGTFHLLNASDYPLPTEYDVAYNNSQTLVVETDIDRLRDPDFQPIMQKSILYPAGQTIRTTLKPATVKKIEVYLASRNMSLDPLVTLKPGMLSVTLTMIELGALGLVGTGVDEYFFQRARSDYKNVRWLETAQEQIDLLAHMGDGHEDELIIYTLDDMKNMPRMMSDMKAAWRKGDSAALEALSLQPYKNDFPELMHMLLDQRNNNWMPTIERMIKTDTTEFILVGALHLVGDNGLLSQLKKRGYKVEKVLAPKAADQKSVAQKINS